MTREIAIGERVRSRLIGIKMAENQLREQRTAIVEALVDSVKDKFTQAKLSDDCSSITLEMEGDER
jgi:hypothetical protein